MQSHEGARQTVIGALETPRFLAEAAVKNSLAAANVPGAGFHAVMAPPRGMTTRNEILVHSAL